MEYIIKTSGIMCGHCEASVEGKLLEVPGVTDAEASHDTNTVQVSCAESVTPDDLRAAVLAAGDKFSVLGIEVA